MDFTVHHEHDSHFDVSGKDGKPFKVAKQGLSPQLLTKIREHQVAQLFEGGKVRGYWDGGDVAPSKGAPSTMDTAPQPVPELASLGPTPGGATYGFESGSGPNPADELHDDGGAPPPAMQAALDAERPAFRDTPPGGQAKAMPEQRQGEASPPKPPDAPVPKDKPLPNPMGGLERDLVAAGRTKSEGEADMATVLGQKGAEAQRLHEAYAEQQKAASEARQAAYAKYQQRANEVAEGIAHGEINPNHYWASKSTGQKIGASIAILLGGVGGALTGQGNTVMQMIDKNIDRDIEAQKAHLDNQKWLVGYYVQQGHSVNEAAQLAKADYRDYTAAMLDASAGKFAGPEAQAMAKQHRGDTQRQTASDRMSLRNAGLEAQEKAMHIELERQQLALLPYQRAAQMAAETGRVLPPEARYFMDPKRTVNVGKGVTYANVEKDRDEAVETQQALRSGLAAADEYEKLGAETGFGGSTSRTGALSAQAMHDAYQAVLLRSNASKGPEESKLEGVFANPTSPFKTKGGAKQVADAFRKVLMRHANAAMASRLVGGLEAAKGLQ